MRRNRSLGGVKTNMGRQMTALYAGGQLPAGIVEMMQAEMTQQRRELYDKSVWSEAFKTFNAGKTYVYYETVMRHIFPGGHMSEGEKNKREKYYHWIWETINNWFEYLVNYGELDFRARLMVRGAKHIPEMEEAIKIYNVKRRTGDSRWKDKFVLGRKV
jgi:hypothetical protein